MTLSALILAGGLSQRMGQDKALLEIEGVSWLRRTWEVAHSITPATWIVTSRSANYRPLLPSTAQWIEDPPPAPGQAPAGPLVAFAHALTYLKTEPDPPQDARWVLLLPCDLPALKPAVLQQWSQALAALPADIWAYVPQTAQGWEPLCGFYHSRCLSDLQDYLAAGGRSFQRWLTQTPHVQPILAVPSDMLINCNTPQEWQTYCDRRH